MPPRSFVTGLVTAGLAATALHVATGPSSTSLNAGQSSAYVARSPGAEGLAGARKQLPWSDQMNQDPAAFGKASAEVEFNETLCEKADFKAAPCVAAGSPLVDSSHSAQEPGVAFAIVPDPIHTHLALWFDRSIDALEDALADGGWRYDRHWMPWPTDPASAATNKFKDREQERLFREGQEELPGVLVFHAPPPSEQRKPGKTGAETIDRTKPLIVFVIGDSPTSGINQTQFREAVRLFHEIAPQQTALSVMGPNFTGSGPSLRSLLEEAKAGDLNQVAVKFASGSINDSSCANLLPQGRLSYDKTHCVDNFKSPEDGDSYVSFASSFAWEVQQTEDFLRNKGGLQDNQIAQLNEDESGLGGLAVSRVESETGKLRSSIDERNILKLTYPRNISHLRSAYQKNGVWGFGGTANGTSTVSLNLDFDETYEADDSVPSYASGQMPVSQEASLGQVSAILEQRRIKAVILSATDVLDQIFVAQMLARQNPNLAVIVRGTDILFLRSGDQGVYHNMYAVSPWPLIPRNYFWSQSAFNNLPPAGGTSVRVFPNDHAQGFYSATRYLLPGHDTLNHLQDYRSPIPLAPCTKDPCPKLDERPPLWMLGIGHGAYWPFALLSTTPPKDASQYTATVDRFGANLPPLPDLEKPVGLRPEEEALPVTQQFLIFAALLLCLLHAGKCFDLPTLQRFAPRYRVTEADVRVPKLWLQCGVSVTGLLILVLMQHPTHPVRPTEWFAPLTLLAGAIALCAALAQACRALLVLNFPGTWLGARRPLAPLAGLFLAITLLVRQGLWAILPPHAQEPEGLRQFFLYRSHFSLGGASPIFPLVLALSGFTIFLLAQMDRLNFGPSLTPRLPKHVSGIPNCPSDETVAPLTGLLSYPPSPQVSKRKKRLLLGVAVLTVTLALLADLPLMTFEGIATRWLANGAAFALVVALLWDLTIAHYLWRELKELCLDPLEHSSLRRGFSSVCGITWKDLWIMPQGHSGLTQYRTFIRALEQTSHSGLQKVAGVAGPDGLGAKVAQMWIDRNSGKPINDIVQSFSDIQKTTARVAGAVLRGLKQSWAAEEARITSSDGPGVKEAIKDASESDSGPHTDLLTGRFDPPSGNLRVLQEEWVALVYLHYIRMVLMQIRSRLLTAAMLYLVLVWAIACYPYLNRHILIIALSVLFGVLAVTAVITYASINRDPILSRTTENEPGSLDVDFYFKTASMVGIPLLGLIASQFPEVSSFLFSWIEPGMAAIK